MHLHLGRVNERGGFTLVETTLAALLVATGVLAVLGAERNARRLAARGAGSWLAVEAAASRLDSARAACVAGTPAVLALVTADVPVSGGQPGARLQVETLAACGAPP